MKWLKRIVLGVVALFVVVVVVVYFSLNAIVRSAVQRQATASLGVPTTLGGASLWLFGGSVSLSDLDVSSPPSFTAPSMFTLGDVGVAVHYGQLTGTPIHIAKITIDKPALIVEQANMKLNLQALMNQKSLPPQSSSGQPTQPIKLVIDELDLNNATVDFHPGIPGLKNSYVVSIPSITLKNIGNGSGSENGAAIKDVVLQAATALAVKGADSGNLPPEVKSLLSGGLGGLSQQLGGEFDKQFQDLAGSLGKNTGGNVNSQQVQQGLKDLLGKNKK